MDHELFNSLFNCLKIIEANILEFPNQGDQKRYPARKIDDESETFKLTINRKGHLNLDNLTYLLHSRHGILIRLDMKGAPHNDLETPHIHIFDEVHENGRKAIHLSEITDLSLLVDISDSLKYFLEYNNIEEIAIEQSLL